MPANRTMTFRCMIATCLVAIAGWGWADPIVQDGSFESMTGDAPAWNPVTWTGAAEFEVADSGRTGEFSVSISSTAGGDASWSQRVAVQPNATYRLSGWIKTEGLAISDGAGALFNIHQINEARTRALTGTNDWTRVEMTFETGQASSVQLNCLFGGWGLATGTAWFDDVELELLGEQTFDGTVAIDAADVGEPISKYIYGQFIEHMGRCIYGGMWAEMLEDRKFFYPITENYAPWGGRRRQAGADAVYRPLAASPWRIIGPADAVTMEADNEWSHWAIPAIQTAGQSGIEQLDLALIEGREYEGRIVLSGAAAAGPVEVSLVWGDGDDDRQTVAISDLGETFASFPLAFQAGGSTENGILTIVAKGAGALQIAAVSLMPADNVQGYRPEVLAEMRKLDSPIYRWPGGNFVSGYEWRDGIGDPDKRPTYKNPAWTGIETNDVGFHEYMALCKILETEPLVTVNSGFGDEYSAMQWVEYANGSADTDMGAWRARNGSPEPYAVHKWCIGNEMWGDWQLGYMQLHQYQQKHNRFANRMRRVDPTIELYGSGNIGNFTEGMLANSADHMEIICEHFYTQTNDDLVTHINLPIQRIRNIVRAHRGYRETIPQLEGKDIRVAITEWNYWYGPHIFGELGTRYFLKDGLGIAAGLQEMFAHSDLLFMANYAQTVNVIGAIKTTKTKAQLEATGYALAMYRAHYGTLPVAVDNQAQPLHISAAWTDDKGALTIGVVNPLTEAQAFDISLSGAELNPAGKAWVLTGENPMVYNDPGQPEKVSVTEKTATLAAGEKLEVGPLSATIFRFESR